jgi:hypothetical protein
MQYSQGHPSGPVWCPFLECQVKKYHHTCQGVKVCENLKEDLKNIVHTKIERERLELQKLKHEFNANK